VRRSTRAGDGSSIASLTRRSTPTDTVRGVVAGLSPTRR
jgi:hypothetical protein